MLLASGRQGPDQHFGRVYHALHLKLYEVVLTRPSVCRNTELRNRHFAPTVMPNATPLKNGSVHGGLLNSRKSGGGHDCFSPQCRAGPVCRR